MPDVFVADQGERDKQRRETVMVQEGMKSGSLASFVVKPRELRFETQEREEEVLLLLRRHVVTLVPWLVMVVVGLVAPVVIRMLPGVSEVPTRFITVGTLAWYLLVWGYILEGFLTWYFNVYIITDERVIDIDFYSLIYKKVSAAKIDNIEDVTFTQVGAIKALLDYGTVFIQTAGERREFEFEDVPHPRKVALFLNEMLLEEERERMEGRIR